MRQPSVDLPISRRRFFWGAGALAASAAMPRVLFANTGGPRPAGGRGVARRAGRPGGRAAARRPRLRGAAPGVRDRRARASPDGALRLDGTLRAASLLELSSRTVRRERTRGAPCGRLALPRSVAFRRTERSRKRLDPPLGTADGWLNRALAALPAEAQPPAERAVAISQNRALDPAGGCAGAVDVAGRGAGHRRGSPGTACRSLFQGSLVLGTSRARPCKARR